MLLLQHPPTSPLTHPSPPLFFDFPLNPWSARITEQFRRDLIHFNTAAGFVIRFPLSALERSPARISPIIDSLARGYYFSV